MRRTPCVVHISDFEGSVATDRAALVALYNATGGPNWTNNHNWVSDAPMGTWHGVYTGPDGHVVELRLEENNLSGAIPGELGNLTNLEALSLIGNNLSGTIPRELSNLTNLEGLSLAANQLSGTIPRELGNLTNLQVLLLHGKPLIGCMPEEVQLLFERTPSLITDLFELGLPWCSE